MASTPPIDYSVCEEEPIRSLGLIQGHGALLVIDLESDRVRFASANCLEFLGAEASSWIGRSRTQAAAAIGLPPELAERGLRRGLPYSFGTTRLTPRPLQAVVHRNGMLAFWEFLLLPKDTRPAQIPSFELTPRQPLYQAAHLIAETVAAITGYTRVMVYRFLPDWSGEVIAETRRKDHEPFLGLRYPATDIPSQARQLYRENPYRVIADVNGLASPVASGRERVALDLGTCLLRSVSPYHLEYLRNMGVRATLTLSLLVRGELWGLVACHHVSSWQLSVQQSEAAHALARRFSTWLESEWVREEDAARSRAQQDHVRLQLLEERKPDLGQLLMHLLLGPERLDLLTEAHGTAILIGETCLTSGSTPNTAWLSRFARWLPRGKEAPGVLSGDRLPEDLPLDPAGAGASCGWMVATLPTELPVTLAVFRNELVSEVHWGGNPNQAAELDEAQRMSPRKSFAIWRDTVRGQASPWLSESATRLTTVREWLAGKLASPDRIEALRRTAANFHEQVLQEPAVTSRILDGLSEGIAVSVAESGADDPRLVAANAGFALLVGIEPASARGKPLLDLLLDAGVRREEANKLLEAGGEVVIWSRRLGPRTVRSRRRNLLTVTCPSKERSLFMLEFLDTTASDQINRALEVARERAENAEAARNAFLANLSHELRTPLIGITGYADLILSETDGPLGSALYREQLEQIRESGDHLLTTVSSLLHYVELKGGNYRRSSIRVDLRKPLQIELARLGSKVARRRILLETRFPDSPLELDVDEGLMRLLATHLLENSVKFTKPGGKILFELASANGNAWIDVRDNGIGIPDALVPRVFSPFFQAEMSVSRGNEGTGLGLPLVKAIAEVHGGSVMLNSQESLGTHVRVLLPMPASSPMP